MACDDVSLRPHIDSYLGLTGGSISYIGGLCCPISSSTSATSLEKAFEDAVLNRP
ncbi:uncharacterized protein BDZ83DRAFT_642037 [Colletotrichum acutatum]|uniref:Uncharacterized protein n=1 Tax=Glomerella acutata TaxID=27357 RepID=A0AAD8UB54_GLOAC|nr:uncharacterized protein BDZ83DRAFT_642037 [Colletotrichum acutatum]KAK1708656.1 hypothetical protein BDZ83DRAFT_642037 [Colletotrichum acutatum]